VRCSASRCRRVCGGGGFLGGNLGALDSPKGAFSPRGGGRGFSSFFTSSPTRRPSYPPPPSPAPPRPRRPPPRPPPPPPSAAAPRQRAPRRGAAPELPWAPERQRRERRQIYQVAVGLQALEPRLCPVHREGRAGGEGYDERGGAAQGRAERRQRQRPREIPR